MTTGILDPVYGSEAMASRAIVASLSEEDRDQLAALALGIKVEDYRRVIAPFFIDHVREEIRREELQERIWQIEADVVVRLAPELAAEIERAAAGPTKTRKLYEGDKRHFAAFCERLGVPAMPASAGALAAYILDGGSTREGLLRRRLAAIADWHRRAGRVMPAKDPLVRVALRHALKAAPQQAAHSADEQKAIDDGQTTGT